MKSHWIENNLSEIIEFNPKETIPKGTIATKIAMEYIQPFCRDIYQKITASYTGGSKFKNLDTIMARITPCLENGKTAQVRCLKKDEVAFGSTEYIILRSKNNISDPNFIYYLATSPYIRDIAIKSMVGSSGRQRVQLDVLKETKLLVPSYEEQVKIGEILSSLDDKIELNNRINKNLEEQVMALFKNWFLDFLPWENLIVNGIPKGWEMVNLGSLVDIKRGASPRPIQDYLITDKDKGFNWLKISDVTSLQSPFVHEIKESIKEQGLNKTVLLKKGSLVLSNSATPGIPKILDIDTCIHDGWLYFNNSKLSNEFLYICFKYLRKELVSKANGSVFLNLKTDIVKNHIIALPPKEILDEFDNVSKPIFNKILNTTRENHYLGHIRDNLLTKLLSGEFDVSNINLDI